MQRVPGSSAPGRRLETKFGKLILAAPDVAGILPRTALRRHGGSDNRIYVAIQCEAVAGEIEFDWDDENKKHLAAHKVAPAEFEQLLNNDPVGLDFDMIDSEERYRSVGLTDAGR
jgi:hypothetical protein